MLTSDLKNQVNRLHLGSGGESRVPTEVTPPWGFDPATSRSLQSVATVS